MKKINRLKRALLICSLSLGVTGLLSPQAFGQVIKITINQLLEKLYNPQVLILDVRTPESWQGSPNKIKGAVRKNPNTFDSWSKSLPKNKALVLYWDWPQEQTSARLAQKLHKKGHQKVYVILGGWEKWQKAGYPIEKKSPLLLWSRFALQHKIMERMSIYFKKETE